jgi:DNA-binding response OmpR family regulator
MKKVLVIETDALTGRRMRGLWKAAGYEVRLASQFAQAAFEAVQWGPDLITLDMDGAEEQARDVLLQLQARPHTSRIPVVLFSNRGAQKIPEALLRSVRTIVDRHADPAQVIQSAPELALSVVG